MGPTGPPAAPCPPVRKKTITDNFDRHQSKLWAGGILCSRQPSHAGHGTRLSRGCKHESLARVATARLLLARQPFPTCFFRDTRFPLMLSQGTWAVAALLAVGAEGPICSTAGSIADDWGGCVLWGCCALTGSCAGAALPPPNAGNVVALFAGGGGAGCGAVSSPSSRSSYCPQSHTHALSFAIPGAQTPGHRRSPPTVRAATFHICTT